MFLYKSLKAKNKNETVDPHPIISVQQIWQE